MTYLEKESSRQSGQIVELYKFIRGSERFLVCSSEDNYTFEGEDYRGSSIKRTEIKSSSNIEKESVSFTFISKEPFALSFVQNLSEQETLVTIYRLHRGDNDVVEHWRGSIQSVSCNQNSVVLKCNSIYSKSKRVGLRQRFEYNCRHTLYGSGCRVNREDYRSDTIITSISGNIIECQDANLYPDSYYNAGIFRSSLGYERFIEFHVGNSLTLKSPMNSLVVGDSVTLYPGCDHSLSACINKFNNILNFGGFPYIPNKNPFGGSSIT